MNYQNQAVVNNLHTTEWSLRDSYSKIYKVPLSSAAVRCAELFRDIDFLEAVIRKVDRMKKEKTSPSSIIRADKLKLRAMEKLAKLCQPA